MKKIDTDTYFEFADVVDSPDQNESSQWMELKVYSKILSNCLVDILASHSPKTDCWRLELLSPFL